jgi:hypothetical protein
MMYNVNMRKFHKYNEIKLFWIWIANYQKSSGSAVENWCGIELPMNLSWCVCVCACLLLQERLIHCALTAERKFYTSLYIMCSAAAVVRAIIYLHDALHKQTKVWKKSQKAKLTLRHLSVYKLTKRTMEPVAWGWCQKYTHSHLHLGLAEPLRKQTHAQESEKETLIFKN